MALREEGEDRVRQLVVIAETQPLGVGTDGLRRYDLAGQAAHRPGSSLFIADAVAIDTVAHVDGAPARGLLAVHGGGAIGEESGITRAVQIDGVVDGLQDAAFNVRFEQVVRRRAGGDRRKHAATQTIADAAVVLAPMTVFLFVWRRDF